jgi:heme-degrading monooxygenase HmoA
MLVSLTIIRYPKKYIPFALIAMAINRLPLFLNKNITFYKLLGCGKNGTFDKHPDWQQWGILAVQKTADKLAPSDSSAIISNLYGSFINGWLRCFNCETWTILLQPLEGHGKWDGKEPFGNLSKQPDYNGMVATLTRATIRISKLKAFWQNVAAAANEMAGAKGFVTSVGIGEMPYIKQATFSIWQSREDMKAFAYQMHQHTAIIQKTRKENWYSEDMFVRFKPLKTFGTIKGNDPLAGKL